MNNIRSRHLVMSLGVAAALAACITVNIYFPAPEVRDAAEEIVEETWGGNASAEQTSPGPASGGQSSWLERLGAAPAYAQDADINVSTAAIRALKSSMKDRAEQLKPALTAGRVGIGRDGMLVVRDLQGISLREQATTRRLVEAENRDRQTLYLEIAKANKFGDDRVPDIQQIFAETWIEKAEKGWPVQRPDGSWTQR